MRQLGGRLVKACAAGTDLVRRLPPGLVVLIYHRVGGRTPIDTDAPLGLFEDQMAYLAERADVVTLDAGLAAIASSRATRRRIVAITFDDGTADFADLALPVLVRHRLPVTIYVATAFIEDRQQFPHDGRPLSWGALRDACSTDLVSVGSHTHTHALLDRLPPSAVEQELDRSTQLIGERVGVTARHFAYPKGVLGSESAQQAVRRRFRSAALAGTRANRFQSTDPYRLARSPVQVSDGMRWFARKAQGGLELEDRMRGFVNRRRHRHATT